MMWLIDYAQVHKGKVVSVVAESLPFLKRGAMRDFLNIMDQHEYFKEAQWNKSDFIYKFETGTIIEFFSVDQYERVKGARRDVLFINEANNVIYESYNQLEVRTKDIVWLDWNPVAEFWWYTEVMPHNDVDFLVLTYLDNEALDPAIVKAIESRAYNAGWFRVYGQGLLGTAEGRIFTNWEQIDIVPPEARLEHYGLDFGYTNDPLALEAIYKYNGGFLIDQIMYEKGVSNRKVADVLGNLPKALVLADGAEPKSIDEIKGYKILITAALKGAGSVLQGIQFVQDQKIYITKNSIETLKEYYNYLWQVDRDGKVINVPSDINNHAMDAIRYGMSGYFVDQDFKNPVAYHPPMLEKLRERGVTKQYGGVGWDI